MLESCVVDFEDCGKNAQGARFDLVGWSSECSWFAHPGVGVQCAL